MQGQGETYRQTTSSVVILGYAWDSPIIADKRNAELHFEVRERNSLSFGEAVAS
jgi:hypothetical protein